MTNNEKIALYKDRVAEEWELHKQRRYDIIMEAKVAIKHDYILPTETRLKMKDREITLRNLRWLLGIHTDMTDSINILEHASIIAITETDVTIKTEDWSYEHDLEPYEIKFAWVKGQELPCIYDYYEAK